MNDLPTIETASEAEKTSMPSNQILNQDPASLTLHPYIKTMPEWAEDEPQFLALVDDIRERGIDQPIIVDPQNRIVDGRHRWRAAKRLRLAEVPTITRAEGDVPGIVINSILQRRHYTKGALAYMTYPLMFDLFSQSKARRVENLKTGQNPNVSRKFTEYTIGKTVEDMAMILGVSREVYFQAAKVHDLFTANPELVAEFEPKILCGDMGLGAVIAGIGGRLATKGKERPVAKEAQLFFQGLEVVHKRLAYWNKLDEGDKREAGLVLRRTVLDMPEELRKELARAIKEAEKNQ